MQWTSVVNLSTSDVYERGQITPLFVLSYIKDCIKKCIKKHICVVYLFPQCVWKSIVNLWKSVVIKMCLGLVILASSLSHSRRNVKGALIKIPKQNFAKLSVFLINTDWKIDNIAQTFYTNKVSLTESVSCQLLSVRPRSHVTESP